MAQKAIVSCIENVFVVQRGDKKDTIPSEKALGQPEALRAILSADKARGTLQNAYAVMLHGVLNRPLLDSVKGKGDTKLGQLDKNDRALIRQAEIAYVKECAVAGIKGIPSDEAAQIKLAESIRSDGNYSNIKNTVVRYLAFCGKYPMTSSGYLVPKAVMQAEIGAALEIQKPDTSIYAKLLAIKVELDKETLSEEASRKAEPTARELASILKGLVAHYDELRTNAVQGLPANAGVAPTVASEVIGKAKKVKANPEPGAMMEVPANV